MRSMISKSVNLRDAACAYISLCCTALADKPSLRKTKEAEGTLGSWRCSACGKPCKVRSTSKEPYVPKKVEAVQGEKTL
jgi:hypothetical protein